VEVRDLRRCPVTAGRCSWGQPDPGGAGEGGSGPDKAGTCQYCQMGRVRRAWRRGVREEPASYVLDIHTGSNLADRGRARRVLAQVIEDHPHNAAYSAFGQAWCSRPRRPSAHDPDWDSLVGLMREAMVMVPLAEPEALRPDRVVGELFYGRHELGQDRSRVG
jgi:hypothetical protein